MALFALLASAGCVGLTGSSPLAPSGAGDLSVDPSPLGFGNVVVGTTNSHPITLSNTGKTDLRITSVAISGKGFSASGVSTPLTLGAGQSADFTASFKPAAAGAASGEISVESSAATMSVSLSGTGVASAPQLSPGASTLSFGNVNVGTPSTQPLVLKNTGNADLEIGSASASGAGFSVTGASGVNLAPNQSLTISVTFDPKAAGSVTGGLTFSTNATNSTSIKLSGAGVAAQTTKHSVALNWRPGSSSVTGYFVYRGTISGGPYSKLVASVDTVPSYTDGSVSSGQTYYYVVTSVDSSDVESAYSNQVSATIPSN